MMGRVSLIAHRGQPLSFPENSLEGFEHVLNAGAGYIETDIHITADGTPILSHDANLLKLTNKQIIISDHSYDEIKDMSAGYAERFGDKFEHFRIASLNQFAQLMKQWPDVTCFIELKKSALSYFGDKAVDLTMKQLEPISDQCVFISFEYEALMYARQHYDMPLGWVLPEWLPDNRPKADELEPAFLFVGRKICPQEPSELWQGSWQWVAYTIDSAEGIDHFAGLGIELLESDRFSELKLESKALDVSHDF